MSEISEAEVRAEVRAWLAANWDVELGLLEWRNRLIDSGWGAPHWPSAWFGRDLPVSMVAVVDEEFDRAGAISVARTGIRNLAAATILAHGSDLHKEKFLRRILTGEDTWCQLFSEPGSGSDLAGATTRAELRGNTWVINGQKVWTTSAHHADYGLLLARSNPDVPKHKGLVYFIIDMHQPGVEVVPLRQMNGHASFNQVFLTDAEVAPEFMVSPGRRRVADCDDHVDARAPGCGRPAPAGATDGSARTDLPRGSGGNRGRAGALQMVSAARRPRRSCDRTRQADGARR